MIILDFDAAPAIARLDALGERLRAATRGAVEAAAGGLLSLAREKLSGDVLNIRSGALLDSLRRETVEESGRIVASVYTDGRLPYARMQEYGGRIDIPAGAPVHANALALAYEGRLVFAKSTAAHTVTIPERSYMRTSLDELHNTIPQGMQQAVADAVA
jgi:hypothetical protein